MAGQRSPPMGKTMSGRFSSHNFWTQCFLLSVTIPLRPGGLSHRDPTIPGKPAEEVGQVASDSD